MGGGSGDGEAGVRREAVDGGTGRRGRFKDLHRGGGGQMELSSQGGHARAIGIAVAVPISLCWLDHR